MRYVATIQPVHADNTVCTHPIPVPGKPNAPSCTGQAGYLARCSGCSWRRTSETATHLEDCGESHLRSHLNSPALTTR
ncbi:hypothetical protein [Streptomyces sp. NPDC057794]|uniref:hypothetical protein n=1 Tax=Streptomyces sp. NPDC057794 TaxID=3346251 RepID=UPI0036A08963